jgi:hypothetical protein
MRPESRGSWDPELLAGVAASSKMRREMDWEGRRWMLRSFGDEWRMVRAGGER